LKKAKFFPTKKKKKMSTSSLAPYLFFALLLVAGGYVRAQAVPTAAASEYRTITGIGNNKNNPSWGVGSPVSPHVRFPSVAATRDDSRFNNPALPNARAISFAVNEARGSIGQVVGNGLNDLHTAFGQLMDHDIVRSEEDRATPIALIPVPRCDIDFDVECSGTVKLGFWPALIDPATGEAWNHISAYMDGSNVFGSNDTVARALREFVGGRMLITANGEVPLNTKNLQVSNPLKRDPTKLRMAGDVRVNVSPQITALHSLFVREHNRWCAVLAAEHSDWDDEKLYQEARRRVIAILEHITMYEYLPAMFGEPTPPYSGYKADLQAQIDVVFSGAAFRMAHSSLTPLVWRLNSDGQEIPEGHLLLEEAVFNPAVGLAAGIAPVIQGMLQQRQLKIDVFFDDAIRNKFERNRYLRIHPRDLFAVDIERCRDLKCSSYNKIRQAYGLPPVTSFAQLATITSDPKLSAALASALSSLYESVDEVDVFLGMLLEEPATPGNSVGPLLHRVIRDQWVRLRDGDRFWYENGQFTPAELAQIKQTTLLDVIRRNVPEINPCHSHAFFAVLPSNLVDTLDQGAAQCGEL
jgi:peroxidase